MDWPSCLCWQLHQQVRTWILKLQHTKISFFSAMQYPGLFPATSSSVSPFSASPSPWDHFPPSALGNCLLMTILRIFPQVSKFTRLPPSMFTFPYTNSELNLLLQMQKQIRKLQKPLLVPIPNPLEKPNMPLRRLWFFFFYAALRLHLQMLPAGLTFSSWSQTAGARLWHELQMESLGQ